MKYSQEENITGAYIGNSKEKGDDKSTKNRMYRTPLSPNTECSLSSSEKPLCSISHVKLYENGKISIVKFNDAQHLTEF